MFGNFVQRIQESFSPVTSPVSSPKVLGRRFKSPNRGPAPARAAVPPSSRHHHRGPNSRRNHKEEYREVQSEPELDVSTSSSTTGSKKLLDKRKGKTRGKILNISDPIPIDTGKFTTNGNGLAIYCNAEDLILSSPEKYNRDDDRQGLLLPSSPSSSSNRRKKNVQYESYKCEDIGKVMGVRNSGEKSHLKEINQNGFNYVNSVPNIVDESLYQNHSVSRDGKGSRKENICEPVVVRVGNRKNSRLQEFQRTREENIYAGLGFAPLQGSKSLGRLDGIKEVSVNSFLFFFY